MSRIVGRVVVGVSGSPESLHALRHAVELARQYEALLIAVNAQPTYDRPSHEWQHTASLVIRDAFEEGLGGLPRDVECMLLAAPGEPGPALLDVANRTNDVLVLGAAHGGGWGASEGGAGSDGGESAADADPRLPGRRQFLPALWRRHVKPVLGPDDARVAAYCLGHAVCSVLSVPPPPLAAPARAYTRLPR
ncbi:MAG TPA: universal stress protein [Actinospica sp.]|nr:universal stress protein [Actinospica sp.]